MATPGQMVKCAAKVLGLPEMTMTQIDRELAISGLRTKGGRGRSAATMNSRDVANLLIGANSGGMVKDTAEAVRSYSSLPNSPAEKWSLEGFNLPSVVSLGADHSFADALQAFIDSVVNNEFQAAIGAFPRVMAGEFSIPLTVSLEFRLLGPAPQAAVRLIVGGRFHEEHFYNTHPQNHADIVAWSQRFEAMGYGDQSRAFWFSLKTIRAMAALLRGEAD